MPFDHVNELVEAIATEITDNEEHVLPFVCGAYVLNQDALRDVIELAVKQFIESGE